VYRKKYEKQTNREKFTLLSPKPHLQGHDPLPWGYNQTMNERCIFCEILAGRAPASFVYRDELCAAFMDIRPVNPGHVLVIPIQHAPRLAELDTAAGMQMFQIGQRLAAALRASELRCEGVNFFLADGTAAGQEVHHVHLHVFPRWVGDAHHLRFGPAYFQPTSRQDIESAAEKLRVVLN
jgi:diadenosine tetraphosphate (Ap4A) HIT family hydrolase